MVRSYIRMHSEMCSAIKSALNSQFSFSDRLKKLIDERESLLDQVITGKRKCCVLTNCDKNSINKENQNVSSAVAFQKVCWVTLAESILHCLSLCSSLETFLLRINLGYRGGKA